ncbi:MAG: transposase family protein [Planctomycetota bacterium]
MTAWSFARPRCEKHCSRYDTRRRSWRPLDTCPFKTSLVANAPRVEFPEHGVPRALRATDTSSCSAEILRAGP